MCPSRGRRDGGQALPWNTNTRMMGQVLPGNRNTRMTGLTALRMLWHHHRTCRFSPRSHRCLPGCAAPAKPPSPGNCSEPGHSAGSVSPCCSQLSRAMRTGVYAQAQASSGAAPAHPLPRLPLTAKTPKAFVHQADVLGSDQLLLPGSALK